MKVIKSTQVLELAAKAAQKAIEQRSAQGTASKSSGSVPPVLTGFAPTYPS